MQMFNGITMGMLKIYGMRFDSPETGLSNIINDYSDEQVKNNLNKIVKQISELKDNDENTRDEVENMTGILTAEFSKNITPETAKKLLEAIPEIYMDLHNDNENSPNPIPKPEGMPDGLEELIDFLEPIANTISESNIEGDLDEQNSGTFKSKINEKREREEKSEIDKFIEKWGENGTNLIDKIGNSADERLTKVKNTIEKIRKIISKPNETNTKMLQKFIYENLDENDKGDFVQKNCTGRVYSKDNFDGKFGISTLNGLRKVLTKMETYITDVKESINVENNNKPADATEKPLGTVKVKGNINLSQGNNVENLVEGLPEGATIKFKEGSSIDGSNEEPQDVIVLITSGGTSIEITITATVDDNMITLSEKTRKIVSNPIDTTPLNTNGIGDGQHSVLSNVPAVAGATFYSYAASNGEPIQLDTSSIDVNGDIPCLMKLTNSNEIYKVKLDAKGNLCPVVESCNKSDNGKRILLKNNPSCIAYLQNKIPGGLPGNPKILWDPRLEDYAMMSDITGYTRGMTVEPIEIDGLGVSPILSEHLIMMNLVNFLRFNEGIDGIKFNNDDPDLRLDDDNNLEVRVDRKSNRARDGVKNKKWYKIPMDRFGFNLITEPRLEKFKKLIDSNNSEEWRDDRDKKKGNKYYGKMKLPSAEVYTGGVVQPGSIETSVVTGATLAGNGIYNPVPTSRIDEVTGATLTEFGNLTGDEKTKLMQEFSDLSKFGNFNDGKFEFNAEIEKTEGNKKYIEVKVGDKTVRINEWGEGMTGFGYKKGDDGTLYIGEYMNGVENGKGIEFWKDGDKFEGDFVDGKCSGYGIMTYKNGNVFEGNCVDGKCLGNGTYIWANGNKFVGDFNDDKVVEGTITLKSGNGETAYGVRKDDKGLKIVSGNDADVGKYIDTETWQLTDTPSITPESPEQSKLENFKMSNKNFSEMKGSKGYNNFIIRNEEGEVFYDKGKVEEYLKPFKNKPRNEIKSMFGKPEGIAFVSAVQILLNEKPNSNKIIVDGSFGSETKRRIENFQREYNDNNDGSVDLSVDGFPGKDTITVLLDGKIGDTVLDGQRHIDKDGKIIFENGNTAFDGKEVKMEGDKIIIDGIEYKKYSNNLNGLGYRYGISSDYFWGLYIGNFVDGKRSGKGTITWADGEKYEGEWENDKRDGQGTLTLANGNKYEGKFKNDKRDGQGTLTLANGNKYEGKFKNNKRDGQGTLTWANGNILKGTWSNNFIPEGTITLKGTTTELNVTRDETKKLWKVTSEGDDYKGKYIKDDTGEFVEDTES